MARRRATGKDTAPDKREGALTDKQRAFVEHYLATWNATEAAKRAGYSAKTAQEQGSQLLSKLIVQQLVEKRIAELKMTSDEVLLRLADQARSDMSDFINSHGEVDVKAARRNKKLHLVKRYSLTDKGVSVELHDAQAALVQIGRILALFADRVEQIDLTKLSTDQLERIAKGENVYRVLATSGAGGTGTPSPNPDKSE